jgi:hypothetical protein
MPLTTTRRGALLPTCSAAVSAMVCRSVLEFSSRLCGTGFVPNDSRIVLQPLGLPRQDTTHDSFRLCLGFASEH